MGKAEIIANQGEGLYQARITYNTTLPAARKTALETRIPVLEQQLPVAETARQTAEANVATAQAELNLLIEQLAAATPETAPAIRSSITEKTAAARPLEDILTSARREESRLNLELTQLATEIATLDALLTAEDIRSIWCADYSTVLSGQVDTIEINGEPGQIMIAPGGSGEPPALLAGVEAMSTANWARNFALHLYWQKWKPTYRTGMILSISGDTATVSLDAAVSSYQELEINQEVILGNVPIQYLDCNGLAFEAGDAVVVRFTGQEWSSPVVVGFEHNPEKCCPDTISIQYTTINMFTSESQELSLSSPSSAPCPVYWSIAEYPQPADWANPSPAELLTATTGDGTRGHLTNLDGSPLTSSASAVLYTAPDVWVSCTTSLATTQIHFSGQSDQLTLRVSGRTGNVEIIEPMGIDYQWVGNCGPSNCYCEGMAYSNYHYYSCINNSYSIIHCSPQGNPHPYTTREQCEQLISATTSCYGGTLGCDIPGIYLPQAGCSKFYYQTGSCCWDFE